MNRDEIALQLMMEEQDPDPRGRLVAARPMSYSWRRPDRELPEISRCMDYTVLQNETMGERTTRIATVQIGPGVLPDEIIQEGGDVAFLGFQWRMQPAKALPMREDEWGQVPPRYLVGDAHWEVELHGTWGPPE
jgi:hypothetical protein